LPKETRDRINRMLDDGVPYRTIILQLGEAGQHLNLQNVTNWKQGGYQDCLRDQAAVEHAKAETEAAIDAMRETADIKIGEVNEACQKVASIRLFQIISHHGDDVRQKLLSANPGKYLTLLNTICKVSNATLRLEKHRHSLQSSAAQPLPQQSISPPLHQSRFGSIKPN